MHVSGVPIARDHDAGRCSRSGSGEVFPRREGGTRGRCRGRVTSRRERGRTISSSESLSAMAARRSGVDRGFPRFVSSAFFARAFQTTCPPRSPSRGRSPWRGVFFPTPNISAFESQSTRDNHTPRTALVGLRPKSDASPLHGDFRLSRDGKFQSRPSASFWLDDTFFGEGDARDNATIARLPAHPRADRFTPRVQGPQHVAHEIERSRDEHVHPPPRVDALLRDDSNSAHRLAKARHHRRRRDPRRRLHPPQPPKTRSSRRYYRYPARHPARYPARHPLWHPRQHRLLPRGRRLPRVSSPSRPTCARVSAATRCSPPRPSRV